MKAGGILLIILAVLLLGGSAFFGYFAWHNTGAAERLSQRIPDGAGFIVDIVKRKAERQTHLSLGLGVPAVLAMAGGLVMTRKAKRA